MYRRVFLSSVATGLVFATGRAAAQAQTKAARVGFLSYGSRQSIMDTGRYQAFMESMRELGYVEGKNLVIEARFVDGSSERLRALVDDLVGLKVDVIVATGTATLRALHHATRTIPVVAPLAADPVGDGLASSLARPGGNVTGLSVMADELGPKHLELLRAVAPKVSRVAVLLQSTNPAHPAIFVRIMSAAQELGIAVVLAQAGTIEEIGREFAKMTKERANGVIVVADPFFLQEARVIADQALRHRLPSISLAREFVEAGF